MNKPTRPKASRKASRRKATPLDIPAKIADRPRYVELTPDEERAFVQELAECEAAYRQTRDPLRLWKALDHVELYGQTVPYWLTKAFFGVVHLAMTDDVISRARAAVVGCATLRVRLRPAQDGG